MNNNLIKKTIAGFTVGLVTLYTLPIYAFASTESVYSKLKADGESYQTIVTTKDNDEVKQEKVEDELPVETKITYTLDGKEISAKDIAGKSGKVSIKLEYINKSEKNVLVNGSYQKMYTPFMMVVGTVIDSNNNKNIEVKNGKVIEDAGKTMVVGVVLPGLKESLNLNNNILDIDIPSSIEITMDSKNFETKNIMSYGTPKIFNEDFDLSKLNLVISKVNLLQSSANQLEEGTNQLKEGITQLKVGSESLNEGTEKLSNGAVSLDNGITALKNGANTLNEGANQLSSGTFELSNGAVNVDNGAKTLNLGIKKLQTSLQAAGNGMVTLQDGSNKVATGASSVNVGASKLKGGLISLQSQTSTIAEGMNSISTTVSTLAGGMNQINSNIQELTLGDYDNTVGRLETLIDANKNIMKSTTDENVKAVLQQNIDNLESEKELLNNAYGIKKLSTNINGIANGLNELNEKTKNLPMQSESLVSGVDALVNGANELSQGTQELSNGASELNNGANNLVQGAGALTQGVSQLVEGSDQLTDGTGKLSNGAKNVNYGAAQLAQGTESVVDGANKLSEGSKELSEGARQLSNGTISLSEGTVKLENGSIELSNGMHKFNQEGISKISNFVNGDLLGLVSRAQKLEELSDEYMSFGSDEKREKIKFISIIDSIKSSQKDNDNQEMINENKK